MSPSSPTADLRALARQRTKEGSLPCEARALFAGYDGNDPCSLCGRQITAEDVIYQAEPRPPRQKTPFLYFHIPCHEAWLAGCAEQPARR